MSRYKKNSGLFGEIIKLLQTPKTKREIAKLLNENYLKINSTINIMTLDGRLEEIGDNPTRYQIRKKQDRVPRTFKEYDEKWEGSICDMNKFVESNYEKYQ